MPGRTFSNLAALPPSKYSRLPLSGLRRPIRWLISVVLPAPSGPMRPWMRPGVKFNVAPFRAWLALSFLKTFLTLMETTSVGQFHFDGQARSQPQIRVFKGDLHAEDQAVAFLAGLDVLGRELGFGPEVADAALVGLGRVAGEEARDFLAE